MSAPKAGPTPGPWKVVRYTGEVTVEAPCGRVLYFAAEQSDENAVADAYLISAVHELRELVEVALNNWSGDVDEWDEAARAALAKAVQP